MEDLLHWISIQLQFVFFPFLDKPLNVAGKLFSIVDLTELPKAVLLGSFSATMF